MMKEDGMSEKISPKQMWVWDRLKSLEEHLQYPVLVPSPG
jgi:hypothetical protein